MKLQWLGGAGFIVKTGTVTIGIDLYLSNSCMQDNGAFKRLTIPPVRPEDLKLDYLLASHEHRDHFDTGSIGKLLHPNTKLICPANTKALALSCGIDTFSIIELNRGESRNFGDFSIRAVIADHGDDAPDAVGFFIEAEGKTIYFVGDSCFRTDFVAIINPPKTIDVMLVPINGKFGNPDARDAAHFTQMFKPRLTIPCHFWLFKEHGGDPGEFCEWAGKAAPKSKVKVMSIGEVITI